MNLRARFAAALRGDKPQPAAPYRAAVDTTEAVLTDIEASLAAKVLRIRALEQQVLARGENPVPTPTGAELLEVANVLDAAAAGDLRRWNTLKLKHLAKVVRGLARGTSEA